MMSEKKLDKMFKRLENDFDVETPELNHNARFLEKLDTFNNSSIANASPSKRNFWKPFIGLAATLALVVTFILANNQNSNSTGLASVSPEMAKTQDFFTSTIALELKALEKNSNPKTKLLIADAMLQINRLEHEYNSLEQDLMSSGNDNRVIYAMISNFQNRIDILQNTLKQIEHVKQLNTITNENKNTI